MYHIVDVFTTRGFRVHHWIDYAEGEVASEIESRFYKRWCEFCVPSLYEVGEKWLTTLTKGSVWGGIYRNFIRKTVQTAADILSENAPASG